MRPSSLPALAVAALAALLSPIDAAAAPAAPAPAAEGHAPAPGAAPQDDAASDDVALPPGTRNGVLRNLQVPPPGVPADVALWNRANDNDLRLWAARGEATRLQAAAAGSGYAIRLEGAVARGALAPDRAAAVRAKLEEEWNEVARILTARWRIDPTRACRYPFLAFDNLMEMADGPAKASRLAEARGRLLECTAQAEAILKQLARANGSLREAIAELDRAAGPAQPAAAATPAGAEAMR